jgi:hypothetical protein
MAWVEISVRSMLHSSCAVAFWLDTESLEAGAQNTLSLPIVSLHYGAT